MHDIKENWLIRHYLGRRGPRNPIYGDMILPVLTKYDVTLPSLRRKDRRAAIVKIRDEVIATLCENGVATAEIAYYMRTAHSTILVSRQRWNQRRGSV